MSTCVEVDSSKGFVGTEQTGDEYKYRGEASMSNITQGELNGSEEVLDCLPNDMIAYILGLATEFKYWRLRTLGLVCKRWQALARSQVKMVNISMQHSDHECTEACQFLEYYSNTIQTVEIRFIDGMDWAPLLKSLLKCKCLENLTIRSYGHYCRFLDNDEAGCAICYKIYDLKLHPHITIGSPHLKMLNISTYCGRGSEREINLVRLQSLDFLCIYDCNLITINARDLLHLGRLELTPSSRIKLVTPKLKSISVLELPREGNYLVEALEVLHNFQVDALHLHVQRGTLVREGWVNLRVRKLIFQVSTTGYTGIMKRWLKWFENNNKSLAEVEVIIELNTISNKLFKRIIKKYLKRVRLTVLP